MFRIGDLFQRGRVSVRTPRRYDDPGLPKPARVDREGGYRLRAPEQPRGPFNPLEREFAGAG